MGLLTTRGQQRIDAMYVLAAIRVLNRSALVAEPLRAALNEVATRAPAGLQAIGPLEWYAHDAKRIKDPRLPREPTTREAYAQTVGEDGFALLEALEAAEAPPDLRELTSLGIRRRTWQRNDERTPGDAAGDREPSVYRVQFRPHRDVASTMAGPGMCGPTACGRREHPELKAPPAGAASGPAHGPGLVRQSGRAAAVSAPGRRRRHALAGAPCLRPPADARSWVSEDACGARGHGCGHQLDRLMTWLDERPRAKTRTSRSTALAPR